MTKIIFKFVLYLNSLKSKKNYLCSRNIFTERFGSSTFLLGDIITQQKGLNKMLK